MTQTQYRNAYPAVNNPQPPKQPKNIFTLRNVLLALAIVFVAFAIGALAVGIASLGDQNPASAPQPQTQVKPKEQPQAQPAPKHKTKAAHPTTGEQNALDKAHDYLLFVPFSKLGLRDQLYDYDHFTKAQANYAVNHLDVNWKHEAYLKAKTYKDLHMSQYGTADQMERYDQFTHAQAVYGAAKAFK